MKYKLIVMAMVLVYLNGCSEQKHAQYSMKDTFVKPTAAKKYAFNKTMKRVARSIRRDRHYKKMSLNTPYKKIWFNQLMYRLWDRQITRDKFISEGLSMYPNNLYEFTFVAHGFQMRS